MNSAISEDEKALHTAVVGWLSGMYSDLPTETVYQLLGDVMTALHSGGPATSNLPDDAVGAGLQRGFRDGLLAKVRHQFPDLDPGALGRVLTLAVRDAELNRRNTGSFAAVGLTEPTGDASSADKCDPAPSRAARKLSTKPPVMDAAPTPGDRLDSTSLDDSIVEDVEDIAGDFRVAWKPSARVLELEPRDRQALMTIAEQLLDNQGILVSLTPAPKVGQTMTVRTRLPRGFGVLDVPGKVVFVRRKRVAFGLEEVAPRESARLRRAAAATRAEFETGSSAATRPTSRKRQAAAASRRPVMETQQLDVVPDASELVDNIAQSNARIVDESEGPVDNLDELLVSFLGLHEAWALELTTSSNTRWRLLFRDRQLIDAEVTPPISQLGIAELVRRSKRCSEDLLQSMIQVSAETRRPLDQILLERGAMDVRSLTAVLTARLRLVTKLVWDQHFIRYRLIVYDRIDAPILATVELQGKIAQRLLNANRKVGANDLKCKLQKYGSAYPQVVDEPPLDPGSLGLDDKEKRFVDTVLTGNHSLSQVLVRSPLRKQPTLALLVTLTQLGVVEWNERGHEQIRIRRAESALRAKRADLGRRTPFELLGCHWSSYDAAVEDAYSHMVRALDLEFVLEHATDSLQQLAQEVRNGLQEAHAALGTRPKRERLRHDHIDRNERRMAIDLSHQQARLALFKGDVRRAKDQYLRCVELNPLDKVAKEQLEVLRRG